MGKKLDENEDQEWELKDDDDYDDDDYEDEDWEDDDEDKSLEFYS
jgi:hypothetical protein